MLIKLSQRGATLIELFAALVLLTFIGAVSYHFLFNSYVFQERSEERIDLIQESNLLTEELRSLHQQSAAIYWDEGGNLYAASSSERKLNHHEVQVVSLSVNNEILDKNSTYTLNPNRVTFDIQLMSGRYTHEITVTTNRPEEFHYVPEEHISGESE
ncbi:PulJ/GspJ family protein [Alkalicoccus daliensis]|uniref:Prepilin-type N-terminal cleavage/methylation domain-containing protein n=1 Tax=Alkalicoccus daliensis TaxID=745820 RepID=A0A1H0IBU3_9BACI|nr:hypothetical protein [Alkalicoccus daliensis]SDO28561.1 hypothetical protein SAMN04488053_11073 [Alkalicoccus daliensis]